MWHNFKKNKPFDFLFRLSVFSRNPSALWTEFYSTLESWFENT